MSCLLVLPSFPRLFGNTVSGGLFSLRWVKTYSCFPPLGPNLVFNARVECSSETISPPPFLTDTQHETAICIAPQPTPNPNPNPTPTPPPSQPFLSRHVAPSLNPRQPCKCRPTPIPASPTPTRQTSAPSQYFPRMPPAQAPTMPRPPPSSAPVQPLAEYRCRVVESTTWQGTVITRQGSTHPPTPSPPCATRPITRRQLQKKGEGEGEGRTRMPLGRGRLRRLTHASRDPTPTIITTMTLKTISILEIRYGSGGVEGFLSPRWLHQEERQQRRALQKRMCEATGGLGAAEVLGVGVY